MPEGKKNQFSLIKNEKYLEINGFKQKGHLIFFHKGR